VGEHEQEGAPSTGATRSQHVVLQGPPDSRMLMAAMRAAVERSRGAQGVAAPACLIITPTPEQALVAAEQARRMLADAGTRVVPVTAVARARRVLAAPVGVVTGTVETLLALRRAAGLSLEGLRGVVVCGLDTVLAAGAQEALVALLADCPDDVSRTVTIEEETPAAAAFVEAQLRRPRRIAPAPAVSEPLAVVPHVALTSASGRAETLRMLLDEVDPPSVVVVAPSPDGAAAAQEALARVGVTVDGRAVQVVAKAEASHVTLLVFWEAPATAEALAEALATRPAQAVALLLPDELPTFRRLTQGEALAWTPAPRKAAAEGKAAQLRRVLQGVLQNGGGATASELALLAPLLETHDALEIAAAALRLLESARRDVQAARAAAPPVLPPAPAAAPAAYEPAPAPREHAPRESRGESRGGGRFEGRGEGRGGGKPFERPARPGFRGGADRGGDREGRPSRPFNRGGGDREGRPSRPSFGGDREGRPSRPSFGGDREGRPSRPSFGGDREGRPSRPSFGGDREGRPSRPSFGGDREGRPSRPSFGGDREGRPSRPSFGGDREGRPSRPSFGGGAGGKGRPPRADEERRAFGDRPARERVEGRSEWQARGERLAHSKRPFPPRRAPGRGADDQG
jgi:ATP-dependent RNA helicase DeaD